jgi:geranylgeranyl transferase type-1 subunit beta
MLIFEAGYTYCGIAALSMLNRLPNSATKSETTQKPGLTNLPATIRWLVSRQLGYNEGDNKEKPDSHGIKLAGVYQDEPLVPDLNLQDEKFVGFNGRCNKNADTCYAFWVGASLDVRHKIPFHSVLLIMV